MSEISGKRNLTNQNHVFWSKLLFNYETDG